MIELSPSQKFSEVLLKITIPKVHQGGVFTLFNLDSTQFLSGGEDGILKLFNVQTGRCLSILREHKGPIYRIIKVKNKVLTSSLDKTYILWDILKKEVERVIPNRHNFEMGFFPIGDMTFD